MKSFAWCIGCIFSYWSLRLSFLNLPSITPSIPTQIPLEGRLRRSNCPVSQGHSQMVYESQGCMGTWVHPLPLWWIGSICKYYFPPTRVDVGQKPPWASWAPQACLASSSVYLILISPLLHPKQERPPEWIPEKTHGKPVLPQARTKRKHWMKCFRIRLPHVQLSFAFAALCQMFHESIDGSDSSESITLIPAETLQGSVEKTLTMLLPTPFL